MSTHTPVELESCSSSEVFEAPPRGGAVSKPGSRSSTAASEEPPAAPRVAWEDNTTTEEHTGGWKVCPGLGRLWEAVKGRLCQTHETEVCAFEPEPEPELPHTSSAEPTAEKYTKNKNFWRKWKAVKHPTQTHEPELPHTSSAEPTAETFHSLYDVGKEMRSRGNCRIHWGYRNSDDKSVLIMFVQKRPTDRLVELPGYSRLLSQEAFTMLRLQKTSNNNIVKAIDLFLLEDEDILVLERSLHYVSMLTFYQCYSGRFQEDSAKHIIRQLISILQHCLDCGFYPNMKKVLIHPITLHVKLVDFTEPLLTEGRREDELLDHFNQILEKLVKRIRPSFWKDLSEESQDLLKKLCDTQSRITLDAILAHEWFNEVKESRKKGWFGW